MNNPYPFEASISIYGDNLINHFFITEIIEISKRYKRVQVFLRYGIGQPKNLEELSDLTNINIIDLTRNTSTKLVRRPFAFTLYLIKLFPWKKGFSFYSSKAAITNAIIGWRVASAVMQSEERSKLHLSYWGRSVEFLVAIKQMNPRCVVGTRLHSFDLYFFHSSEFELSTRLNTLNALDFVAPISSHGAAHLKKQGVKTCIYTSYLGCKENEFSKGNHSTFEKTKPNKPLKIVTIAKIVPLKRIDYTIQVLRSLDYPVIWHQYGRPSTNDRDADHTRQIHEMVIETKSSQLHLELKGEISNRDLRKILVDENYDFSLLLSETEGVPVSLIESLAADVRIVVTDTNGCPELIRKDIGCLIPVDASVHECATRIKQWWFGLSGSRKDGAARNFWKEKFDSNTLYDEFAEFMNKFIQ